MADRILAIVRARGKLHNPAILLTADTGTILFFSMVASFSTAPREALGA